MANRHYSLHKNKSNTLENIYVIGTHKYLFQNLSKTKKYMLNS